MRRLISQIEPPETWRLNPLALWRRWTALTTDGELARRREAVLLNVLAAMVVLSLLLQLVQIVDEVASHRAALPWFLFIWLTNVCVGAGFYGLLRLARSGRHRAAAISLIVVLGVMFLWMLVVGGVVNPMTMLVLCLTVVLATLLLGRTAGLVVVVAATVVMIPEVWSERSGGPLPLVLDENNQLILGDLLGIVVVVAALAWICWTYTREALTSIDEMLTHGSESSPLRQLRTKTLSVREIEVVQLVAEGLSNDQIASRLFLSPRTVQSHVANAMKKTSSANRTELGVLALREGLVPLHGESVGLPRPTPEQSASDASLAREG